MLSLNMYGLSDDDDDIDYHLLLIDSNDHAVIIVHCLHLSLPIRVVHSSSLHKVDLTPSVNLQHIHQIKIIAQSKAKIHK